MAKHKLTPQELLKGAEKALRSRKTPKQLRAGIRKLRDKLRREIAGEKAPHRRGGFLGSGFTDERR